MIKGIERIMGAIDWVNSCMDRGVVNNCAGHDTSGLRISQDLMDSHSSYLKRNGRQHLDCTIFVDDVEYPTVIVFQTRTNEWCAFSMKRIMMFDFSYQSQLIDPENDRNWFAFGSTPRQAVVDLCSTLRVSTKEMQEELEENLRALASVENLCDRIYSTVVFPVPDIIKDNSGKTIVFDEY